MCNQRTTMSDVAIKAGVSLATVSHVINKSASISKSTTDRVNKAIKELNYHPNLSARNLRKKQTKQIGLVVPDITNEFYAYCFRGILESADYEKYSVMLMDYQYKIEKQKQAVNALIENQVDGIIFIGGFNDKSIIQKVHQYGIPLVLGDRYLKGFSSVEFNDLQSTRELVQWLHSLGYKKFCYVTESIKMTNLESRYEGYLLGLKDCNLHVDNCITIMDPRLELFKLDTSARIIEELIKSNNLPQIFITSSDIVAIGIISTLRKLGIRVPEDVGIVGHDDISIAKCTTPALTTVSQNAEKLGNECFNMLHDKIINGQNEVNRILLETSIKVRESILL